MKSLNQQIKEILKNECLSQNEKVHLKEFFRSFSIHREVLRRNSISEVIEEEEGYVIDGITGGFNFQNAWTGAWIASHNLG